MDIPDKEVSKTISSGASRVRNRIQWARMYLVKSDLMDSSQRGIWKLTEKGFEIELNDDSVYMR
jgi:restriction system protein